MGKKKEFIEEVEKEEIVAEREEVKTEEKKCARCGRKLNKESVCPGCQAPTSWQA